MKPVAGSTGMKPVLHEAVRREYNRGVENCSVETAASITAPAKLILDLMPIIIENVEPSMVRVCVDRLDLAVAILSMPFKKRGPW